MASASIDSQMLTGKRIENVLEDIDILGSDARYRIRYRNIGGRTAVVVEEAKSFWDKLMSYLPSLCFLRKRFVNEMKVAAQLDDRVGQKILDLYEERGILAPYFTLADINNLKRSLEARQKYDAFENRTIDVIDRLSDFWNWLCCRGNNNECVNRYCLTVFFGPGNGNRECVEQMLPRLDKMTGCKGIVAFPGESSSEELERINKQAKGMFNCNLLVCIQLSRIGSDLAAARAELEGRIDDEEDIVCMVCHYVRPEVNYVLARDACEKDDEGIKRFKLVFDVGYFQFGRGFELTDNVREKTEITRLSDFIRRGVEREQRRGKRRQFYRDHGCDEADL